MPELPDVETYKRYFDVTALHKTIASADVLHTKILDDVSEEKVAGVLAGQTFTGSRRHGKYLFAETDSGPLLMLHFGMTGWLDYHKQGNGRHDHTRLEVRFDNGYVLEYVCQRLLGKVGVVEDVGDFIRQRELGPDALDVGRDYFREEIGNHRGSIKSTLMNQSVMAGIGNVYSDEILFRSGIDPRRKANELSGTRLSALYDSMMEVLDISIECKADPDAMPPSFITPRRSEDAPCPNGCQGTLKKVTVSGRSAHFCPTCQS